MPELGHHGAAEVGQLQGLPLPQQRRPTELVFKLLDRFHQRRLRHVAAFCRTGEVRRLGKG